MRKLVIAGGALLVFAAGSLVAIMLATRGTSGVSPAAPPGAPEPGAAASPPPGPPPVLPPAPDAGPSRLALPPLPPVPPVAYGPPPPKPPEGSWEAVAPVARPATLGAAGVAVGRELLDLQPKLSACFDEVSQARHGQTAYTTVKDHAPTEDSGTTILMLQLETLRDEVRIADAPVETRGGASDGLIACAQKVLRGHRVSAPGTKPGARHRVLFTLTQ